MQITAATSAKESSPDFLTSIDAATPHVLVTPALLAINIGMFLVMTALGVDVLGGRAEDYLRFGANFPPLTSGGEWWRLITCTFMHFGILHLAFNMWALWDAGRLTERLFGNAWFGTLYLFAGVAGSCASTLWNPQAISAGASGAVFGVFGALLAYMTVQRGSIPDEIMNRLRISTGIFVTCSLFYGFAKSGIDNAAHLGGLVGGYAMGLIMARPLAANVRDLNNPLRSLLAALLAVATLSGAALLTPDTARVYRQAIALQKESEAFSAEEIRLNTAFQQIVEQTRSGKMHDAVALKELRVAILPAWDSAVARLNGIELDAKAPMRKDYELLLHYATARRDMARAIADFLESGNPADEKRLVELRARVANAFEQYQQRQTK